MNATFISRFLATWEKKGNLDAADLAKFQEEFS